MASLLKAAIKYEAQEITKIRETNAMFYFSDGSQFNKKEFNKRLVVIREMREDAISQNDVYAALKKEVDAHLASRQKHMAEQIDRIKDEVNVLTVQKAKQKTLGGNAPSNALRYIILRDLFAKEGQERYRWYFASEYTGHAELEDEFRKLHGAAWDACGGGFYVASRANANVDLADYWAGQYGDPHRKEVLMLFGKSDSFGLRKEVLEGALPVLREQLPRMEIRVMSNLNARKVVA